MEDKLKKFIDSHREAFDDELLPEGHFERFEARLPGRKNNNAKLFSLIGFAAAACIALLLIYQIPFGGSFGTGSKSYVCEIGQEVDEIRTFYSMQMNDILLQMEEMYEQDRTLGAAELLKESKKVQLDTFRFEEDILPTLPCDEEVFTILSQHYGNSLQSMNIMLEHMEQIVDNTK